MNGEEFEEKTIKTVKRVNNTFERVDVLRVLWGFANKYKRPLISINLLILQFNNIVVTGLKNLNF